MVFNNTIYNNFLTYGSHRLFIINNITTMYKAYKKSLYTGKTLATETFETLAQAIEFIKSNQSATGSFVWKLRNY
jgi:hypothetical protein